MVAGAIVSNKPAHTYQNAGDKSQSHCSQHFNAIRGLRIGRLQLVGSVFSLILFREKLLKRDCIVLRRLSTLDGNQMSPHICKSYSKMVMKHLETDPEADDCDAIRMSLARCISER